MIDDVKICPTCNCELVEDDCYDWDTYDNEVHLMYSMVCPKCHTYRGTLTKYYKFEEEEFETEE